MAQKTSIILIDDIDGSPAEETITFALDGVSYEIDLNTEHATQLREVFATYLEHGRRVTSTRTPGRRRTTTTSAGYDAKAVRAWAGSNGVDVPARGRIPTAVLEQFRAAGN